MPEQFLNNIRTTTVAKVRIMSITFAYREKFPLEFTLSLSVRDPSYSTKMGSSILSMFLQMIIANSIGDMNEADMQMNVIIDPNMSPFVLYCSCQKLMKAASVRVIYYCMLNLMKKFHFREDWRQILVREIRLNLYLYLFIPYLERSAIGSENNCISINKQNAKQARIM